jgi:hypothetical protein
MDITFMNASSGDQCQPLSITRRIEDFPVGNIPLSEHLRHLPNAAGVAIHPLAWLDADEFDEFVTSGDKALAAADGSALAWRGSTPDIPAARVARKSFFIRYPWDLLAANERHVS